MDLSGCQAAFCAGNNKLQVLEGLDLVMLVPWRSSMVWLVVD